MLPTQASPSMLRSTLSAHIKQASRAGSFWVRRWQSSFTFSSNKSLLQKEQVKDEKHKKKQGKEASTVSIDASSDKKASKRELRPKFRNNADYSWLPKAPSTAHLKARDVSTTVLYSGYRPFFMKPVEQTKNDSTLYEFAMKLENLSEPLPWISSATGTEFYGEWDSVPTDVIKKLRPFQPPSHNVTAQDLTSRKLLHEKLVEQEKQKLINRSKGRKKPVIRLMQLRKKLNDQEGD
ncbi:LAME_0F12222g1_1 [Lachancea meyersii CBS 8951]|uniref:LAME_0F12222g1_1 n=1 Tax=Lachancea meyersii CBS 8951 TaxID=1266667 RepID=A0A1G4JWK7_9SACH|nr:LAME_0F12222g1_1 [Lachancea meyersii CBS 8951]